jgi:hypothetical protein
MIVLSDRQPALALRGKIAMDMTQTLPDVQYITRENGQRVGVVLAWEDYRSIQARLMDDPDLLIGLSEIELSALSDGVLAVEHQARLSALLERNRAQTLTVGEAKELDRYLEQIDSLNILKARARLTLQYLHQAEQVN